MNKANFLNGNEKSLRNKNLSFLLSLSPKKQELKNSLKTLISTTSSGAFGFLNFHTLSLLGAHPIPTGKEVFLMV